MPLAIFLLLFPAVSFAETADYSIYQDSIPKITVRCTADLADGWEYQLFPKDVTYYGIYIDERVKNKCTATRITGKDTLVNIPGKALTPMIIPDQQNPPEFIITNLPLKDGQWLMGKSFPNRMLFPGESIPFMGSWLYATGVPQTNVHVPDPFTAINDYKLILRQPSRDGRSIQEETLFTMTLAGNGAYYEGGIHIRWIGDLDQDGKIDILLTYATDYKCFDVILFLSSKAEGNRLLSEAARHRTCRC
jgi:hypothetical protein